ncbi:alpha-L-rhamnosidase [Sphingobacterium alkalisoli]|uniref:alpha-L-rhamnosidase n=1 Tax=Sphingobacterium alkalisoli TaxID=1874115 RepID=A0A4V5LYV7_9SPHI|nr:family 78 glycoside hydrolase catalytic domain [Sphingobacterium alkalisoli]TJY67939.1 alpha-L-rhamnosidase [Sphingobacterium alkalisoli]GGH10240.1 hydrolase [Sphingobacterium alkalisoli]
MKIIKYVVVVIVFVLHTDLVSAQLRIREVTIEGRKNPLGINTLKPSFSWKLTSRQSNVEQAAYRIQVAKQPRFERTSELVWDSNWRTSDRSLFNPYEGDDLAPGTTYAVLISVKDNKGRTAKSNVAYFHTGLITGTDWGNAQWIAREELPDSLVNPLPLSSSKLRVDKQYELPVFRKTFSLSKKVKSSYAYVSGLGHYELSLNGRRVDQDFLQPGWTKYDKEAYYVVYDLKDALHRGRNVFSVLLGNGFYYIPPVKGRYQKHKVAFGLPKLKMKVVTHFTDGSTEVLDTDQTWRVHSSPIVFSSMYGGEDVDARVLPGDWMMPDYDDSAWVHAIVVEGPPLRVQEIAPTKVMQTFQPISKEVLTARNSEVYDFGQNASGIVTLTMRGDKGDTVRVYPAELLHADGSANQKHSGSPYYYQYIFGDEKEVTWSPRFTYYGFRYAEVMRRPRSEGRVNITKIESSHIRNSTRQTGAFVSSDTLFNKIHELIKWGIQSNMVSVFTDCPHREKLGWLEQLHLMGPSVQYNFDAAALFAKALRDMRMSQTADGLVPEIAPEYVQFDWGGDMFRDSPEWGSSSIILPWYAYQWYGDIRYLRDNYGMMKRYIDYLKMKSKDHILTQGLGDWYDIGTERPGVSQLTTMGVTGTAIYYYNLGILVQIAELLGYPQDSKMYDHLRKEVKAAFNKTFFDKQTALYATGSQTSQAMALYMDLVEVDDRQRVFDQLLGDIYRRDTSFTSGDIGHRYLLQTLHDWHRDDVIYAMNHDDSKPGYGYQIRKGATALTESWAALPNVSNNHFMLGHLMEWFHAGLGGIRQADGSVGFKHLRIEPRLLDTIEHVKTSYETPYGLVLLDRKNTKKGYTYHVEIPVNSKATVILPQELSYKINNQPLSIFSPVRKGATVSVQLGSGKFLITN